MKKIAILIALCFLLIFSYLFLNGSSAIDVFSATRSSEMVVVSDASGFVGITSTSPYHRVNSDGTITFDFTTSLAGGFNPKAYTEINDLFTVTNQSGNKIYVWFEANDWSSQHNAGLEYRIQSTDGVFTPVDDSYFASDAGRRLLYTTGSNYIDAGATQGYLAYLLLQPGESFVVRILVNTNLCCGYGSEGYDWTHDVIIKANKDTAPTQPGTYHSYPGFVVH